MEQEFWQLWAAHPRLAQHVPASLTEAAEIARLAAVSANAMPRSGHPYETWSVSSLRLLLAAELAGVARHIANGYPGPAPLADARAIVAELSRRA